MKKILLGLVFASLAACTSKNNSSATNESDSVKYDYKLELNDKVSVPQDVQRLVKDINDGKEVSFDRVTDLLIRENSDLYTDRELEAKGMKNAPLQERVDLYKSNLQEHKDYIASLVDATSSKDFISQKSQYESKIESLNGSSLTYNKDYNTTMNIQKDSKMQCDSGTNLNLIIGRRSLKGSAYRKDNRVVVLSPSHVQPGQIKEFAGTKNLIIVETTESGDALQNAGAVDSPHSCMQIVDADSYVLVDALSRYLTAENKEQLVKQIVSQTAKKYAVSTENLNSLCRQAERDSTHDYNSRKEDESLFTVSATKRIPDGDIKRTSGSKSVGDLKNEISAANAEHAKNLAYLAQQEREAQARIKTQAGASVGAEQIDYTGYKESNENTLRWLANNVDQEMLARIQLFADKYCTPSEDCLVSIDNNIPKNKQSAFMIKSGNRLYVSVTDECTGNYPLNAQFNLNEIQLGSHYNPTKLMAETNIPSLKMGITAANSYVGNRFGNITYQNSSNYLPEPCQSKGEFTEWLTIIY